MTSSTSMSTTRITDSGFQYVGQRLSEGLPGIYWASLFGAEFANLIGEERLRLCPASRKDKTPDGTWILFSSASPEDYATEETQRLRAAMRSMRGSHLFFDVATRDAAVTPLAFDRATILRSARTS